jgi:hypothetical protein
LKDRLLLSVASFEERLFIGTRHYRFCDLRFCPSLEWLIVIGWFSLCWSHFRSSVTLRSRPRWQFIRGMPSVSSPLFYQELVNSRIMIAESLRYRQKINRYF